MIRALVFLLLFPPLCGLFFMLSPLLLERRESRGSMLFAADSLDVLGLSYLVMCVPTLALVCIDYFAKRFRFSFVWCVLAAAFLSPWPMYVLLAHNSRFGVYGFVFVGTIGALAAFVCWWAARLVPQARTA